MSVPAAPAPGFYPDPLDPAGQRWWDGTAWTETVRAAAEAASAGAPEAQLDELDARSDDDDELVVPTLAPEPVLATAAAMGTARAESPVVGGQGNPVPVADLVPEPEPIPVVAADPAGSVTPGIASVEPVVVATQDGGTSTDGSSSGATSAGGIAEAVPAEPTVPPGLYPDPYGQAPLRRWDGTQWTAEVSGYPAPVPEPRPAEPASPARTPGTILPTGQARPAGPTRSRSGRQRPGARVLAASLVLLTGVVARGYFLYDHLAAKPTRTAAQHVQAINLRQGDLPTGWRPAADNGSPAGSSAASGSTAGRASGADSAPGTADGAAVDRAIGTCLGASDPAAGVLYAAGSPMFTRGTADVSSDVTMTRTTAAADQDLRARRSSKLAGCVTRVGTPAFRTQLAHSGVTLTGLSVTRLPGVPADGFAYRLRMDLRARGRQLTVWTDCYGFVRGRAEVGLTLMNAGHVPDGKLAGQLLRTLRARTVSEVSLGS